GQGGEDVVDAEEQSLLFEISHQTRKVISPALNLEVLAFHNVVNPNMDFVPTGRPAGDLLAEEKVRMPPKGLPRRDRIMIGYSDQIQPLALELLVEGFGRVIALAAKTVQHRHGSHAGVDSVDVEVTSHILDCIYYVTHL